MAVPLLSPSPKDGDRASSCAPRDLCRSCWLGTRVASTVSAEPVGRGVFVGSNFSVALGSTVEFWASVEVTYRWVSETACCPPWDGPAVQATNNSRAIETSEIFSENISNRPAQTTDTSHFAPIFTSPVLSVQSAICCLVLTLLSPAGQRFPGNVNGICSSLVPFGHQAMPFFRRPVTMNQERPVLWLPRL